MIHREITFCAAFLDLHSPGGNATGNCIRSLLPCLLLPFVAQEFLILGRLQGKTPPLIHSEQIAHRIVEEAP